MIRKLSFYSWMLGLLFLLVVNVSPARAAGICTCMWTDNQTQRTQEITATSQADCTNQCIEKLGSSATGTWMEVAAIPTSTLTIIYQPPIPPTVHLDNPLGSITSPQVLLGRIINSILGIVGSLALLMFVFGGITWMTSSGNQEKVKKGRDIIVWSAIGLAVIFMSYALIRFVLSVIVK